MTTITELPKYTKYPKTNQPQAQNTRYSKKNPESDRKKHTHWSQLRRAWGRHVPPFYKWLGTGGNASSRTANKKLTTQKRSPKRLIVLVEPKSGGVQSTIFMVLRAGHVPPPHFQIHSGATEQTPGLQKFGLGRHKTLVYTAA